MKLLIFAVGNKMPDWIKTGYLEYIQRLPREISVHLIEIKPEKRTSGKQTEHLLSAESQRIRSALPPHCHIVVLDEHGEQYPTINFAHEIKRWMSEGNDVVFIIGGADGLHVSIKQMANEMIALSKLTLPHGLVRVLLAEQLYRAASILHGHPYHRA